MKLLEDALAAWQIDHDAWEVENSTRRLNYCKAFLRHFAYTVTPEPPKSMRVTLKSILDSQTVLSDPKIKNELAKHALAQQTGSRSRRGGITRIMNIQRRRSMRASSAVAIQRTLNSKCYVPNLFGQHELVTTLDTRGEIRLVYTLFGFGGGSRWGVYSIPLYVHHNLQRPRYREGVTSNLSHMLHWCFKRNVVAARNQSQEEKWEDIWEISEGAEATEFALACYGDTGECPIKFWIHAFTMIPGSVGDDDEEGTKGHFLEDDQGRRQANLTQNEIPGWQPFYRAKKDLALMLYINNGIVLVMLSERRKEANFQGLTTKVAVM
ncbi:hypothetical protein BDZ89DRAFT_1052930 [Hymenopellis radicata]|nr:hypothetical protein BDZ89DRAFT_1052930 [Hymenopellis radicata]